MTKDKKDGSSTDAGPTRRSRQIVEGRVHMPSGDCKMVSPVVVSPKKDGRWRICVEFKPLNVATKKYPYPLPFIDQILDSVAGYERYSVCDGFSGYFQ